MRFGKNFTILLSFLAIGLVENGNLDIANAHVALMAGQRARPLNGRFNKVPVLHSNQPEIVKGPGILINTAPGAAIANETGQLIKNATYTFNGDFGVHMHHKYYPSDENKLGGIRSRGLLTIGLIAINTSNQPVKLTFDRGSVKNSFEAPYHPNKLMGVKPLGKRPWNTGPGDATSVLLLRHELDKKISKSLTIPAKSHRLIISTELPARGIANGLLRGKSDGPFHLAVVAQENPRSENDLIAVLKSKKLAPGRIYLQRLMDIYSGKVFSRVAGVAIGDEYSAMISHDLRKGSLHVPLTSTSRHHFGTRDIQVNTLKSRMIDSALTNVGTYGVRFDVGLNLTGSGHHKLVLSHPVVSGKTAFTAFRGSIRIQVGEKKEEIHVGLRSGESLALKDLNISTGKVSTIRISLVYPADATPGHLLSVVPVKQLARLNKGTNYHYIRGNNLTALKNINIFDKKERFNQDEQLKGYHSSMIDHATTRLILPPPIPAIIPINDLKRILKDYSMNMRLAGLNLLNFKAHLLNETELIELVKDLLDDFREEVVIETIKILQRRNEERIIQLISQAARKGRGKTVEIALMALGSIGTKNSILQLSELYSDLTTTTHKEMAKKQLSHQYIKFS